MRRRQLIFLALPQDLWVDRSVIGSAAWSRRAHRRLQGNGCGAHVRQGSLRDRSEDSAAAPL